MQDSMLLDGKLREYQKAFQAVDTSGNGTLGVVITVNLYKAPRIRRRCQLNKQSARRGVACCYNGIARCPFSS